MVYSVNVRTLAETYYEGGDLESSLGSIERMQEGLTGHLLRQNTYTADYRAEVPVKLEVDVDGVTLEVQGRVDGLMLKDGECLVEEIKTTRLPPEIISENDYPVHWAQAEIYAFMLACINRLEHCGVRLVYLDLTGERKTFERQLSADELSRRFYMYAGAYAERIKRKENWLSLSLPSVRLSGFPFASFREGQRALAEATYKSIKHRTRLLCEAPTGIGKTAATLFPAIKALGEGLTDVIFYLTARGTGRLAAEQALRLMRQNGLKLRSVSISAKRKLCPTPFQRCDAAHCPRAKGHFDRQKAAIIDSWSESAFDENAIRALSEKYGLCPFELTLALSETAQVIICDYNYVFDPAVRLKRFFDHAGRYSLLVDEAHNLVDRSREMYSAELSYKALNRLRQAFAKCEDKRLPLYGALDALIKTLGKADENELRSELPTKTIDAVKLFLDEAKHYLGKTAPYSEALAEEYFNAAAFLRASGDFDEECFKVMVTPEGKRNRMKLWCWNPTPRLKKTMKRMCGAVMFSATLTPIEHYAGLLGVNESDGDKLLALTSPFPRENLLSLKIDIATRYSKREESALDVAKAIHAMATSAKGNYIACFPSHAYLNLVYGLFSALEPHIRAIKQEAEMDEQARLNYLGMFEPNPKSSLVAFIAMGGVFAEGIDLPGDRLIGAAIVGVGLPQIGFERDALKAMYDDDTGSGGFETAYVYPGFGKCLQAAGRVIRTATDRGAVLFIDERYMRDDYAKLFPEHMKPKKVSVDKLSATLKRFWSENGANKSGGV